MGKELEGDQESGLCTLLSRCGVRPPHLLLMIRQVGWVRLWDAALGLAYQGTPVVEQGIEPPWEE